MRTRDLISTVSLVSIFTVLMASDPSMAANHALNMPVNNLNPASLPSWNLAPCNEIRQAGEKPTCFQLIETGAGVDEAYTFQASSIKGTGVAGVTSASIGHGEGVIGAAYSSVGVRGWSTGVISSVVPGHWGVWGDSAAGDGVGVVGTSQATGGVWGRCIATSDPGCIGVKGDNTNGTGVLGQSTSGFGMWGGSSSYIGVYGQSSTSHGLYGLAQQGGHGVVGISSSGDGLFGSSTSGFGVYGFSSSGIALYGSSTSSHGLYATTSSASSRAVFGVASNASGGVGVWGEANNAGTGVGVWGVNSNAGGWAGYFSGRLGVTGTPFANQTTFALFSDARLKKNVKPLEGALEKLLQLRGVTFEWKNPAEHGNLEGRQTGFIAQDVEKVFPNWVTDDPSGFKTMTTRGLEAMLIESLRTLKNENDQNLRTLKNENDELRVRIRALEGTRGIVKSDVGLGGWGVAALLLFGGVVAISARRRPRTGA